MTAAVDKLNMMVVVNGSLSENFDLLSRDSRSGDVGFGIPT
jgi:hypothetical protein